MIENMPEFNIGDQFLIEGFKQVEISNGLVITTEGGKLIFELVKKGEHLNYYVLKHEQSQMILYMTYERMLSLKKVHRDIAKSEDEINELNKSIVTNCKIDFGCAIGCAKKGKKIAREGWNDKNIFVYYVPAGNFASYTEIGKSIADADNKVHYEPYLAIKNVKGTVSTWIPSINDVLAEDWYVVD